MLLSVDGRCAQIIIAMHVASLQVAAEKPQRSQRRTRNQRAEEKKTPPEIEERFEYTQTPLQYRVELLLLPSGDWNGGTRPRIPVRVSLPPVTFDESLRSILKCGRLIKKESLPRAHDVAVSRFSPSSLLGLQERTGVKLRRGGGSSCTTFFGEIRVFNDNKTSKKGSVFLKPPPSLIVHRPPRHVN
jgi:hypothetical protein